MFLFLVLKSKLQLYIEGYLQAMLDVIYKQEYLRVRVIEDQASGPLTIFGHTFNVCTHTHTENREKKKERRIQQVH